MPACSQVVDVLARPRSAASDPPSAAPRSPGSNQLAPSHAPLLLLRGTVAAPGDALLPPPATGIRWRLRLISNRGAIRTCPRRWRSACTTTRRSPRTRRPRGPSTRTSSGSRSWPRGARPTSCSVPSGSTATRSSGSPTASALAFFQFADQADQDLFGPTMPRVAVLAHRPEGRRRQRRTRWPRGWPRPARGAGATFVLEHGYCRSLYVRDPNGLLLEFTLDHPRGRRSRQLRAADAHEDLAGGWPATTPATTRTADGTSVRALLVSDLHYDLRKLDWVLAEAAGVDLLVVAGDLLDIGSAVPLDAQIAVVLEYLASAGRARPPTVVCSGNHDLDHRTDAGEKATAWIAEARASGVDRRRRQRPASTAGRSRRAPGGRGPRRCGARSPRWPPAAAAREGRGCGCGTAHRRVRCRGPARSTTATPSCPGCSTLHRPDIVLCGHIHEAPFVPGGAWAARQRRRLAVQRRPPDRPGPDATSGSTSTARSATWWSFEDDELSATLAASFSSPATRSDPPSIVDRRPRRQAAEDRVDHRRGAHRRRRTGPGRRRGRT